MLWWTQCNFSALFTKFFHQVCNFPAYCSRQMQLLKESLEKLWLNRQKCTKYSLDSLLEISVFSIYIWGVWYSAFKHNHNFFEVCSLYKTKQLCHLGKLGINEHISALEVVDIVLDIYIFWRDASFSF